jgi:hypothetical protein
MPRTRKPISVVFPRGLELLIVRLEKKLGKNRSEIMQTAFMEYWKDCEIVKP